MIKAAEYTTREFRWIIRIMSIGILLFNQCNITDNNRNMFASDYREISISRSPAFDFILSEGEAIQAKITFVDDSTGIYEGLKAVAGNPAIDSCYTYDSENKCITGKPFGPIALAKQHIDSLHHLIRSVPEKKCRTERGLACDYGVICKIATEYASADNYCCGKINEGYYEAFYNLIDYMDYLTE